MFASKGFAIESIELSKHCRLSIGKCRKRKLQCNKLQQAHASIKTWLKISVITSLALGYLKGIQSA